MKGRDTQFRHDLKKKERELSKLKERVHQLMTDKNQERRIGNNDSGFVTFIKFKICLPYMQLFT